MTSIEEGNKQSTYQLLKKYIKKYQMNNPEKMKKIRREYYENNKDERNRLSREYAKTHKHQISENNKKKIRCEVCDIEISKCTKFLHQKTKKHLFLLDYKNKLQELENQTNEYNNNINGIQEALLKRGLKIKFDDK